jgi:hypothetical protein
MSSVNSQVAGIAGGTAAAGAAGSPLLRGALSGIAQQLDMSVEDVQGSLRQGVSIGDLARQKGISRSALADTVQQQIQQARQANGQPPLDQKTLDRIVDRAFDQSRRPAVPSSSPLSGYTAAGSAPEDAETTGPPARISIYA